MDADAPRNGQLTLVIPERTKDGRRLSVEGLLEDRPSISNVNSVKYEYFHQSESAQQLTQSMLRRSWASLDDGTMLPGGLQRGILLAPPTSKSAILSSSPAAIPAAVNVCQNYPKNFSCTFT